MSLTAIHIRTGEAGLNRTVEGWLARHNLPARVFADAYEACVYLIANASTVADFAFIGADWLTPEEWPIVRYLHETWPSLAVIVYASRRVPGLPEPLALRAVCTSPRMLDRVLEGEPDNLLRSMRSSTAEDLQAASEPSEPSCPSVIGHSAASILPERDVQGDGSGSAALVGDSPRNNGGGEPSSPVRHQELWLLGGQED